jgi:hypothetical protein
MYSRSSVSILSSGYVRYSVLEVMDLFTLACTEGIVIWAQLPFRPAYHALLKIVIYNFTKNGT